MDASTPMGRVISLYYCDSCSQRRFALAIMDCTGCGRKQTRCPRYQFPSSALCERCAAAGGRCARCGEIRLRRERRK